MKQIKYVLIALLCGLSSGMQAQTTYFEISDACISNVIPMYVDAALSPFNNHDVYSGVGTVNGNANVAVLMYYAAGSWVIEFGSAGVYYYSPSNTNLPPTSGWIPIDVNGNGNANDDCEGAPLTVSMAVSLGIESIMLKSQVQDQHVYLQWETTSTAGVELFRLERSTQGSDWESLAEVSAVEGLQDYMATDMLRPNVQHLYRVAAVLSEGGEVYSNIIVARLEDIKSISVYPNPATDVLNLEVSESGSIDLTIYDNVGRAVLRPDLNAGAIDISDLNVGHYILRVSTEYGVKSVSFYKN